MVTHQMLRLTSRTSDEYRSMMIALFTDTVGASFFARFAGEDQRISLDLFATFWYWWEGGKELRIRMGNGQF